MDTKEQVYDTEISPLMENIIGICKRRGIAMVATFHLPDDEQDTLYCTTCLTNEDEVLTDELRSMVDIVRPKPAFMAFTITRRGSS